MEDVCEFEFKSTIRLDSLPMLDIAMCCRDSSHSWTELAEKKEETQNIMQYIDDISAKVITTETIVKSLSLGHIDNECKCLCYKFINDNLQLQNTHTPFITSHLQYDVNETMDLFV